MSPLRQDLLLPMRNKARLPPRPAGLSLVFFLWASCQHSVSSAHTSIEASTKGEGKNGPRWKKKKNQKGRPSFARSLAACNGRPRSPFSSLPPCRTDKCGLSLLQVYCAHRGSTSDWFTLSSSKLPLALDLIVFRYFFLEPANA